MPAVEDLAGTSPTLNRRSRHDRSPTAVASPDAGRQTWQSGASDALPEFLLALASGRMKLTPSHMVQLQEPVAAANLPPYLQRLAGAMGADGRRR